MHDPHSNGSGFDNRETSLSKSSGRTWFARDRLTWRLAPALVRQSVTTQGKYHSHQRSSPSFVHLFTCCITASSVFPASGLNSGSPNLSTPKVVKMLCTSDDKRK